MHLVCRLLPRSSTLFPYTTLFRSPEAEQKNRENEHEQRLLRAEMSGQGEVDVFADRKSTRLNSSHLCISYAVFSRAALRSFPTRRSSDLLKPNKRTARTNTNSVCCAPRCPARVR